MQARGAQHIEGTGMSLIGAHHGASQLSYTPEVSRWVRLALGLFLTQPAEQDAPRDIVPLPKRHARGAGTGSLSLSLL